MLVTGYLGEAVYPGSAALWGFFSAVAYFAIVYEIWLGGAAKLAKEAGGDVLAAHKILCWFVLVGWIIYPLGYLVGTNGIIQNQLNNKAYQSTTYNKTEVDNKILANDTVDDGNSLLNALIFGG